MKPPNLATNWLFLTPKAINFSDFPSTFNVSKTALPARARPGRWLAAVVGCRLATPPAPLEAKEAGPETPGRWLTWGGFLLLMDKILRSPVEVGSDYPIIYKVENTYQVVVWDFVHQQYHLLYPP